MKRIAIIGAGQLGSRHLQGLALHKKSAEIYVIDPSEEALKTSEQRFLEADQYMNKKISYSTDFKELPQALDFVIIATNSLERLNVLKKVLQTSKVQYLLLEKFLD